MDFFFPKTCVVCKKAGEYICTNCFSKISYNVKPICAVCNNLSMNGITHPKCFTRYSIDACFSAVVFNFQVRKIVYALKYKPFLSDLISEVSDLFYEVFIQNEMLFNISQKYNPVLIPIPLSSSKMRQRGYNQSELLAKNLSKRLGLQTVNLLIRTKETKPQFGLSKIERKENMKDAFGINNRYIQYFYHPEQREGSRQNNKLNSAFLVDDVLTTGSTLLEAANVLKRNGFKRVYGLCFAREQNF